MPGQAETWPSEPIQLNQPTVPDDTVVYAVGDVHGCAGLLRALHEEIERDAASVRCRRRVLVYLGDYVDRGPSSKEVVDILLGEAPEGFECHFLKGNHEAFLLDFLNDVEAGPGWLFNGGISTLRSYGVSVGQDFTMTVPALAELQARFAEALPDAHRAFYEALECRHVEGDYLFVHAGIRPGVALDEQDEEDLLWIRDEFLASNADHGKVVVHGHTITWDPEFRMNRIGIDTGAFSSGVLTCLALEGREQDILSASGDAA